MRSPSTSRSGRLRVRQAAEVGDADDGELEALGGVDRHQPHRVRLDALDGRVGLDLPAVLCRCSTWSRKPRRSRPSSASKRRARRSSLWTLASRRSPQSRPSDVLSVAAVSIARSISSETVRRGALARSSASSAQKPASGVAVALGAGRRGLPAVLSSGGQHRLPHAARAARGRRARAAPARRSEQPRQRRGERRVQRQLVQRVGQRPQVGEQVADLLVAPEAADGRERAQAAQLQRALEHLEVAASRAAAPRSPRPAPARLRSAPRRAGPAAAPRPGATAARAAARRRRLGPRRRALPAHRGCR